MSQFEPAGIVTLLTDFGQSDTYVGQMKGMLLTVEPALRIVDLTHRISPQDVAEGAFQLATAVAAFPDGCVHLAVVDPGVGSDRRAIVVQSQGRVFVAPDNGLLSYVLDDAIAAFEISKFRLLGREPSSTFHGRDVFAPVAGRLAAGVIGPEFVGPAVELESLVRLATVLTEVEDEITGTIAAIDHFGNCLTAIGVDRLPGPGDALEVMCGQFHVVGLSWTYSDVEPGEPLAVVGSHGAIELAVRNGDAAQVYGLTRGDRVVVTVADTDDVGVNRR